MIRLTIVQWKRRREREKRRKKRKPIKESELGKRVRRGGGKGEERIRTRIKERKRKIRGTGPITQRRYIYGSKYLYRRERTLPPLQQFSFLERKQPTLFFR